MKLKPTLVCIEMNNVSIIKSNGSKWLHNRLLIILIHIRIIKFILNIGYRIKPNIC